MAVCLNVIACTSIDAFCPRCTSGTSGARHGCTYKQLPHVPMGTILVLFLRHLRRRLPGGVFLRGVYAFFQQHLHDALVSQLRGPVDWVRCGRRPDGASAPPRRRDVCETMLLAEGVQCLLALALLLDPGLALRLFAARLLLTLPLCLLLRCAPRLLHSRPLLLNAFLFEPLALLFLLPLALLFGTLVGLKFSQPLCFPLLCFPGQPFSPLPLNTEPLCLGNRVDGGEVHPHQVRGGVTAPASGGAEHRSHRPGRRGGSCRCGDLEPDT
mmetsp:Transcript_70616/g.160340  ORF Transcript_70616/g.160340 Transcript_70616/m.160340 type:complete len:269 (-) Transcript_70616:1-807(-)